MAMKYVGTVGIIFYLKETPPFVRINIAIRQKIVLLIIER